MTPNAPRRRYERHGLARGETLQTFKVCQDLNRNRWVRIFDEWRASDAAFTVAVIKEIGLRPKGDQTGRWMLTPCHDLSHLLDLQGEAEPFDADEWFSLNDLENAIRPVAWRSLPNTVREGAVFKPGHIQWRWAPLSLKGRRSKPE